MLLGEEAVNLNEELEQEKEANEGIAAEYQRLINRTMESKRVTVVTEQLAKLLHTELGADQVDTDDEIHAIIDYITGPEQTWCSSSHET